MTKILNKTINNKLIRTLTNEVTKTFKDNAGVAYTTVGVCGIAISSFYIGWVCSESKKIIHSDKPKKEKVREVSKELALPVASGAAAITTTVLGIKGLTSVKNSAIAAATIYKATSDKLAKTLEADSGKERVKEIKDDIKKNGVRVDSSDVADSGVKYKITDNITGIEFYSSISDLRRACLEFERMVRNNAPVDDYDPYGQYYTLEDFYSILNSRIGTSLYIPKYFNDRVFLPSQFPLYSEEPMDMELVANVIPGTSTMIFNFSYPEPQTL